MEVAEETPAYSSGSEDRSSNPGLQTRKSTPSPAPSLSLPPTRDKEIPTRSSSPRQQTTSSTPQTSRDKRRHGDTGISERLISLLEEPVPKPHMPDGELDECYHFALSLVPMLHRLDKNKRQQAKFELLNTLHNLEQSQQLPLSAPLAPFGWQSYHPPPTHTAQPLPTFSVPSHQARPSHSQSRAHPPQSRPVGPFMEMLIGEQWEEGTPGESVHADIQVCKLFS